MKINNVELEDLDFMDLEVMERFEELQDEYNNKLQDKPDFEKTSELIRYHCEIVFDLFNGLFGDGTDKKVFGNKTNLLKCTKAVDELFMYIEASNKNYAKEFEAINKHVNRRR